MDNTRFTREFLKFVLSFARIEHSNFAAGHITTTNGSLPTFRRQTFHHQTFFQGLMSICQFTFFILSLIILQYKIFRKKSIIQDHTRGGYPLPGHYLVRVC